MNTESTPDRFQNSGFQELLLLGSVLRLWYNYTSISTVVVDITAMFVAVGAEFQRVAEKVLQRRAEIQQSLALPKAA